MHTSKSRCALTRYRSNAHALAIYKPASIFTLTYRWFIPPRGAQEATGKSDNLSALPTISPLYRQSLRSTDNLCALQPLRNDDFDDFSCFRFFLSSRSLEYRVSCCTLERYSGFPSWVRADPGAQGVVRLRFFFHIDFYY